MAELGRRIGMSAPAVAERVQRLERAGVITGYHAELDPQRLGFPRRRGRAHPALPRAAAADPRDRARHRPRSPSATGSRARTATSFASTCARSTSSRTILDRFTPYGQTTTSIIHSAPVPRRGPPLEDAGETL